MKIDSILNENLIDLDMQVTTKDEAIRHLTARLYKEAKISGEDAFLKDIYIREAEGKTGIGGHIAIPHGKSDAVNVTSIAVGRTSNKLKWETPDGLPVHFIIMFAVRNVDKTTVHLKLLSQVATVLADEDVLNQLLTTQDKKEVITLLSQNMQ